MKSLFIIFFFFVVLLGSAQNLVPNPSFEEHDTCPNNQGQFSYINAWENFSEYSPDYFNSCNPCLITVMPCTSVPYNFAGYRLAATGNAYAGIYTYETTNPYNIRECIGVQLNSPMIIDTKYYASFKASLALNNPFNTATDKLGMLFSTIPFNLTDPIPINNFAHIFSTSVITDTLNWTLIQGSIIADSAYQYVIIGNFFDDSNTNLVVFDSIAYLSAYYFIDDVYVSTQPVGEISQSELKYKIKIYPNPAKDFFTIEINLPIEQFSAISLLDALGNEIKKIHWASHYVTIPISDLNNGIYFIKINTGNTFYTDKIIINN